MKFSVSDRTKEKVKFILKILDELNENAKISDRKIAKKLKTSQSTISRHRQFLEKNKIITRYTIWVDTKQLLKVITK